MGFPAFYQDGKSATGRQVYCQPEGDPQSGTIAISDTHGGRPFERWKQAELFIMASRKDTLRIGSTGDMPGARLVVEGREDVEQIRVQLPSLAHHRAADRLRQVRLIGLSMAAMMSVILAYLYGVPLLSGRVVEMISPQWEAQLGETVAEQVAEHFGAGAGGLELCDPNPESIANLAIAEFAQRALETIETPFDIRIAVVRSDVPNAFALPGGRIYFFEGLLREAVSGDEFAGVLAHEIGHVIHRHGMEQLVASAGTGLLVGFVLGDITGISVAGALGSMLIDSRFSREHELAADRFARDVAVRLGFDALALADLLDRVAEDDGFSRALALLSTHPLTDDRRHALEVDTDSPATSSAFTAKQWYAISQMCGGEDTPRGGD